MRNWDTTFGNWDSKYRNRSEVARDALVIVKEGNALQFKEKYETVFAWLLEHGYLTKVGKGYGITPLGLEVIQRKRVVG